MSKTRGPSKAQTILNDAKDRVQRAREKVTQAQQEVITATQVLVAYESNYDALEKALARATPRRMPKQEPVKKGKDPVCDTCGNPADASGHDLRYISSHPFASGAGKKSSRKGAVTNSTANTEVETVAATAAASGD